MAGPLQNTPLQRHFATVRGQFGTRQVHYRRGGQGPAVLLLHQSPQSSREMEPLILAWGHAFTLIAPDSPGYGFSEPLQRSGQPVTAARIEDFAAATLELADALGIGSFGVYGYHTGASIGVALAHACPTRVTAVAANGLVVLTENERAALLRDYAPALVPRWDGSHLAWLWGRMREQTMFFPWHDRRAATRMQYDVPSADHLQTGLQDFLEAGDHYQVAYVAAFSDRAELRLPALNVPVLVTAAEVDPLAAHLARIGARSASVRVAPAADADDALARAFAHLAEHLAGHKAESGPAGDGATARSVPVEPGSTTSGYLGPPGGQLRILRTAARGAASGRTVILLHAPAGSASSLGSMAQDLAAHADVLAVDLPGHGASDPQPPLAGADGVLAGTTRQLAVAFAGLHLPGDATLLGIGSSARLTLELAATLGGELRVVLLEPPTWSAADAEAWLRDGLPPLNPVWSGGHLLEAWHLIRDGRLFAPWFRRERAAIRSGEPDLDEQRIHRDVRDLLRANGAWQALLRDALGSRGAAGTPSGMSIIRLDRAPANWAPVLGRGP